MSTTTPSVALRVDGLSKNYPGVAALRDVSLTVLEGEVHGLVGENGAGKSTLMKAVAGAIAFDGGRLEVRGTVLAGGDPRQAANAGVAMIYQELTIVPEMSAVANVMLGRMPTVGGVVNRAALHSTYKTVAARVACSVPARARAGDLSTAQQQQLEIMRALVSNRRLVIMDEPTASLGPEDIERLHRIITDLKSSGHSIIYVSHDLDAVLDVCDRVTVLREGAVVVSRPASEWTTGTLIEAMLGGVSLSGHGTRAARGERGASALTIDELHAPGVALDHFDLRHGEIVGIAGLVGSGRSRLLRTVIGDLPLSSGSMTRDGYSVDWPRSPHAAWRAGIALAPEDRKRQGLVLGQPSAWNIGLGWFARAAGAFTVRLPRLTAWARPSSDRVAFAPDRLSAPAGTLSGGNQQKLVLARLLARPVDVILLDEPTRGIDIGAKAQIFETMRALADNGLAILWSSSEIDEVVEHSDRILVVAGGRVVTELPAGSSTRDVLTWSFSGGTVTAEPTPATSHREDAS
ncbi:ribose transport system ATP-binding protein [Salinibacterium sp. CAN_S4]|uniref:sugar ABC transporter ATP-binding protein n=1 Tax=Salinibacterium sp. CAN_S4 TaxID=2787727 RepID=UPI0018EF8988